MLRWREGQLRHHVKKMRGEITRKKRKWEQHRRKTERRKPVTPSLLKWKLSK